MGASNKPYFTLVIRKNNGATEPTVHGRFWSLPRAVEAKEKILKRDDVSVRVVEIRPATQVEVRLNHPVGPAYRPPFHGFPIVAQIPGPGIIAGWGVVVERHYGPNDVDYIAFWAQNLRQPEWGQGHYYQNRDEAVRTAWRLAGWSS